MAIQQALGIPKGRAAGAKYLREFIEDVKASGLVARAIEKAAFAGYRSRRGQQFNSSLLKMTHVKIIVED